MKAWEVNFDAIVGPTHHYAGLSWGNVASWKHCGEESNPRQAALEGLRKMKFVADLGVKQAVLPPQLRPDMEALRSLGFAGSDAQVLAAAWRTGPQLLAACSSASAMWAANSATLSPSADTADGRVHFTVANLVSEFHRSLETAATDYLLRQIFSDPNYFVHHGPLPASTTLADEGAANHMRLWAQDGQVGVEIFVWGRDGLAQTTPQTSRFPPRQTLQACQAIARRHLLAPEATVLVQQNPAAIDAGVFHNDVAAVSHKNVLLYHQAAWKDKDRAVAEVREKFRERCGSELYLIEVPQRRISLQVAVRTYLFNSQIVSLGDGSMALIAPQECQAEDATRQFLAELTAGENPIRQVHYLQVRQSMRNGGGPACLRLRVMLGEEELRHTHQGVLLSDQLYHRLTDWVSGHYRSSLRLEDLAEVKLLEEGRAAMAELCDILQLNASMRLR